MQKSKLTLAVIGALFAMSAEAGTYILQANKWGAEQAAAVAAAGGTVRYASAGAGLAVVDSNNPGFAAALNSSRAVRSVTEDMVLNFKMPGTFGDIDAEAITPGTETFWNTQWAPKAIEAPAAWNAGFTGAGVTVAVIDGGIHSTHIDIAPRLNTALSTSFVPPGTLPAGQFGCNSGAYNCDSGTFWHGTHVAGIVAAPANNLGTIGIAPDATIVGVKALHGGTGSFGSVIAAILYSADIDADIINMSLGADIPRGGRDVADLMTALNRAVNYATARGSLVVVAAGNDGFDMDAERNLITVPAESGNAIAVSATGPFGMAYGATDYSRPASYTNYGNSIVWVSGPGGDFAWPTNEGCSLPRIPSGAVALPCWAFDMVVGPARGGTAAGNGSYSWSAGTSMAAPAVAGVAALIKQRFPNATPAQLKTKLAQSATDEGKPGQDAFHGHGFINARRAVTQ